MRPLLALLLVPAVGFAQTTAASSTPKPPAAIAAIREQDIKRDLYVMGGDAMRGREAGTLDEMRASMYVADMMRQIGLKPSGLDGTYFQWWNMRCTRVSTVSSRVRLGDRELALWTEAAPTSNAAADVSGTTIFVGDARDTTVDVRGKVVVATLVPGTAPVRTTTNTYDYNYTRAAITSMGNALARRGAAAVVIAADSMGEIAYEGIWRVQMRGTYEPVGGAARFRPAPPGTVTAPQQGANANGVAASRVPVLFVRRGSLAAWRTNGQAVEISTRLEVYEYPSVNIIGVVPGTDPKLRDEYVMFSSHQDHDGVRYPVAGDSIWNGADDNASTSVALFAIARAWVKQPSKRSAVFIFHGAEEKGLLGSRYYVAHPVIPLEKVAAVLNGDMMGRNSPDTAALLGSQPPHRVSNTLVQMAIDANRATSKFVIDSSWDRPTHPEGWYFRSDHAPYAERKVPALMFSTNLHPDYHTPRDEPSKINYEKLTRMARWMYMTGWIAANAAQRPPVDPGFALR